MSAGRSSQHNLECNKCHSGLSALAVLQEISLQRSGLSEIADIAHRANRSGTATTMRGWCRNEG